MLNKTELCPIKDKNYDFTTDTSIKVREALRIAVLRSCHKVQENKKKLEEPDSIKDYQNGFSSCLSRFFKELITVLVKKKFAAAIQKRKERDLAKKKYEQQLEKNRIKEVHPENKLWKDKNIQIL
ncbi:19181_t:CDS:2 [Cetraspora pellucida]|uniref:19181_t:CDS:1 n=1 Tax=Cetraspora pellucida TaxID=1433469 RepID=A0A9N9HHN2_9GLOM|nr:19181_t:CDS:2 [Cetraspora pellucida]